MNALAFELPGALEAAEPPEARGIARDRVRLMVARRSDGSVSHAIVRDLADLLTPGDLVVINVSATLPAAVASKREDGSAARVHFATRAPGLDPSWRVVELRSADGARPARAREGERIALRGGGSLELVAPYASGRRLMLAHFSGASGLQEPEGYLGRFGQPIRYRYVKHEWPLEAYQNVYAVTPGSAEMPSAGRPFTSDLLARLLTRGVQLAPLTLHAGVSSPERHEPPFPEYYEVPDTTAKLVTATRQTGHRVIAVGTTVVRALETVTRPDGSVRSGSGWTQLVISSERRLRAIDGLITGWHEPRASHLELLVAVAGEMLLERSYREALDQGYLWHEFGDSHLLLP